MTQEKELKASNGYIMLFVFLILFFGSIIGFIVISNAWFILGIIIALFILPGLILVNPNGSRVLLLFGDYKGTVKQNGLFWVNPFYTKKKISLRARNFDSERLKVNDKLGNPVPPNPDHATLHQEASAVKEPHWLRIRSAKSELRTVGLK